MTNLTAKEINDLNRMSPAATQAELGTVVNDLITRVNKNAASGTPVNAVAATKTLSIVGVVTHGETLSIDNPAVASTDKYEFLADDDQVKTISTNIAVDITASTTKASGTLTIDTKATAGDTMTIGTKKYTFVAVAADDQDGEISVGADKAGTQANIVAAVNGTDGHNTPNPDVTIADFAADDAVVTAKIGGTIGNNIATTETFTAASNVFAAAALGSGADCSAANAITALVAAITASDTQGIGAVDGAGDTIVLTADTAGTIGNAIAVTETLINGSLPSGATVLAGGVNGTLGVIGDSYVDASYLYHCIAANTVSGANWRRISLGSVY